MPFIQKEGTETVVLNCNLWDWSLLAQMGEAHQFSQISCTSQGRLHYIIKKRDILLPDHILCIIESCIY